MQASFTSTWAGAENPPCSLQRPAPEQPCQLTIELQQGTGGVRIISTARVCEVYSLDSLDGGGEASYVCSVRGVEQPPGTVAGDAALQAAAEAGAGAAPQRRLWMVEHCWPAQRAPPPAVMLRLLSLAGPKDALWLERLELLPAAPAAPNGTEQPADDDGSGAAAAGMESSSAAAGGAGPQVSQGQPSAGSQIDDVRLMLSRMAAEEASGGGGGSEGGGGQADPKRALIAAIAKSVLQQPRRPQQAQQQQEQQEQRVAAAVEHPEQPLEPLAVAVGRLEQRVAAVEALCGEMHAMLVQLVQQREQQYQRQ